jgi:hypothetical protein
MSGYVTPAGASLALRPSKPPVWLDFPLQKGWSPVEGSL